VLTQAKAGNHAEQEHRPLQQGDQAPQVTTITSSKMSNSEHKHV